MAECNDFIWKSVWCWAANRIHIARSLTVASSFPSSISVASGMTSLLMNLRNPDARNSSVVDSMQYQGGFSGDGSTRCNRHDLAVVSGQSSIGCGREFVAFRLLDARWNFGNESEGISRRD